MKTIRPSKTPKHRWSVVAPGLYSVALGNGSQFTIGIFGDEDEYGLCVGVEGRGFAIFTGVPHWSAVHDNLNLMTGDAKNVADLIAHQFADDPDEVGHYNPKLCK